MRAASLPESAVDVRVSPPLHSCRRRRGPSRVCCRLQAGYRERQDDICRHVRHVPFSRESRGSDTEPQPSGVVGRKAASEPDFAQYTPALKASGITRSTKALDKFPSSLGVCFRIPTHSSSKTSMNRRPLLSVQRPGRTGADGSLSTPRSAPLSPGPHLLNPCEKV